MLFLHPFYPFRSYGLNVRGLSNEGQDAHPIDWQNVSGLPLATPDPGSASDPHDGKGHHTAFPVSPRTRQIQLYVRGFPP